MSNKCFVFWCNLLSALILSSLINADYPSNGVNLEYCRTSEDCAESRPCLYAPPDTSSFENCTSTAEDCFCRYLERTECVTSEDCPVGERCFLYNATDPEQRGSFCWTCRLQLSEVDAYVDADPTTCEDVWLGGYTGDICHRNYYDCAGDRNCVQFLEDGTYDYCPLSTEPCFCWPQTLTTCTSSADCENQERCATNEDGETACFSCGRVAADDTFTQVDSNPTCSSPSPITSPSSQYSSSPSPQSTQSPTPQATLSPTTETTQSPSPQTSQTTSEDTPAPSTETSSFTPAPFPGSPTSQAPCIAVVHLSGFEEKDLVFGRHIRAGVLCDDYHSCATPGHMVVFRNRAMTMASYCAEYSTCSRRIAWVNNPRIRQALRVASLTEGLRFTAFSARYETKIEEYFLKLVISSGI